MDAFLISTGLVALAEMGDKTQLLSLVLATRHRRAWPIVWGILVATLLNHSIAGALGAWIDQHVDPEWMRWVLGAGFLAMALWMLVPDKLEEEDAGAASSGWGVFCLTVWVFFLAEMGDKTQAATVALGAQYEPLWAVVLGTTFGMLLANVPVVFLGEAITRRIPIRLIHLLTAVLFAIIGLWVLLAA
ncbi:TMEM165/GDT1 family protein [Hydrogenophaga sp. 5NK40-0174]|uniref:TMEM165/GDT1 family protein n=1 Tax=Hydrogenophaga sp. 5NK40-0174 TaxID=3127649 RepID=UPI003340F369